MYLAPYTRHLLLLASSLSISDLSLSTEEGEGEADVHAWYWMYVCAYAGAMVKLLSRTKGEEVARRYGLLEQLA